MSVRVNVFDFFPVPSPGVSWKRTVLMVWVEMITHLLHRLDQIVVEETYTCKTVVALVR